MTPTRFDNLLDLARLPYFSAMRGRLVLADRSLAGAIDVHTHFATCMGTVQVDLSAAPAETQHYQPTSRPFDLDCYANRNFTDEDLKKIRYDFGLQNFIPGGMRSTHTVPNLLREMEELGIQSAVVLPIDFALLTRNSEICLDATRGNKNFVCFGSVHPLTPFLTRRLDKLWRMGARGIKVHPAVQLIPPESRRAMALYRACGERKLPILFHCGPVGIESTLGRRFSQVYRYERALAENPETTFVLGHSGALQMREALGLAHRYPNTYLEVASQGLDSVRQLVAEAPEDRVMFGTDWPFYHQAMGLAKVLLATEGNDARRRKILHENAARLFLLQNKANES